MNPVIAQRENFAKPTDWIGCRTRASLTFCAAAREILQNLYRRGCQQTGSHSSARTSGVQLQIFRGPRVGPVAVVGSPVARPGVPSFGSLLCSTQPTATVRSLAGWLAARPGHFCARRHDARPRADFQPTTPNHGVVMHAASLNDILDIGTPTRFSHHIASPPATP